MAGHRRHTTNISALRKNIIRREKIFIWKEISVFANNALSFLASYIINLNSISELCAARNLHYNYKIISGFHFVTKLQRIVVCKLENYTTSPAGCSSTHHPPPTALIGVDSLTGNLTWCGAAVVRRRCRGDGGRGNASWPQENIFWILWGQVRKLWQHY